MSAEAKLPIYGVPVELQGDEINAWCWGDGCGKGCLGAIMLDEPPLSLVPCNEAECPFLDKQMDEPIGTEPFEGRPVYLRKLRSLADEVPSP